ncbi:MAG: glycosyltransferase [Alphaproteobacteria bacterium]|nr:MAG: glycosyltransferase [Alphaproteobacteria bacterium]
MAKVPVAGRVKTRLGREIGMTRAAWWFRHNLAQTVRACQSRRWETILAVAPDRDLASPALPPLPRLAQGPGDLGARMARVFRAFPASSVLIVGSDIPGLSAPLIAAAFRRLSGSDAVIGPAPDGGYWAIGRRGGVRIGAGFLRGVRWSGEHALADTLATMPGLRLGLLPEMADVDTAADLSR